MTPSHEDGAPDFAVVDLTAAFIHRQGNAAAITVRVYSGGAPFSSRMAALLSITDEVSHRVMVFASQ